MAGQPGNLGPLIVPPLPGLPDCPIAGWEHWWPWRLGGPLDVAFGLTPQAS